MAKIVGFGGRGRERKEQVNGYHQSYYTQAIGDPAMGSHGLAPVGSYYDQQPERLTYPNASGSPQYSGYGDVSSHDMFPYGQPEPPDIPKDEAGCVAQGGVWVADPLDPTGYMCGWNSPGVPDPVISTGRKLGALAVIGYAASVAGSALGAYHGYKRNNSVGWAIGWFIFGGALPFLAVPVAFAQGVGKRKVGR